MTQTGLLPIIRAFNGWFTEHYDLQDIGLDPPDDDAEEIRTVALLIQDRLEKLRGMVQRHQMEKADDR